MTPPVPVPRLDRKVPGSRVWIAALIGLLLVVPAAAFAADRLTARVGLCQLEAPPSAAAALTALAARAPTILARLEADLGARPASRYRMILIPPGAPADSEIARLEAAAPPWAAGYLIPELRIGAIRIAESSQYPYGTLESVLAHEAAHMLLHDGTGGRLPRWFDEGVATWEGRRWSLEDAMVYSTGLLSSDLPRLAELNSAFHASAGEARLAYAASFAFVARTIRRDKPGFLRAIVQAASHRPFPEAWEQVTGTTLERAEEQWRRDKLDPIPLLPIITASSTLWL